MPKDTPQDHKAEALKALARRVPKGPGSSESTLIPDYGAAQVHAFLAIAVGQERVAEELELLREGLDGIVSENHIPSGEVDRKLRVTHE